MNNGYKAFYKSKEIEVYALNSYAAQCEAARVLNVKPKNAYQIAIVLCERSDGSVVSHNGSEF